MRLTLQLSLDEMGTVEKALNYYRSAMEFNATARHSTEEEKIEATRQVKNVDAILGRSE